MIPACKTRVWRRKARGQSHQDEANPTWLFPRSNLRESSALRQRVAGRDSRSANRAEEDVALSECHQRGSAVGGRDVRRSRRWFQCCRRRSRRCSTRTEHLVSRARRRQASGGSRGLTSLGDWPSERNAGGIANAVSDPSNESATLIESAHGNSYPFPPADCRALGIAANNASTEAWGATMSVVPVSITSPCALRTALPSTRTFPWTCQNPCCVTGV